MSKIINQPLYEQPIQSLPIVERQKLTDFLRQLLTEIETTTKNKHPQDVRYIINEDGEWLGLLLPSNVTKKQPAPDPDLLLALSKTELQALSDSKLALVTQTRLSLGLWTKRFDITN